VPQATFNYIAGLEWIRAKENLCLVGPAGKGKSHLLWVSVTQRCRPDSDFQLAKTADFEVAIDKAQGEGCDPYLRPLNPC
jgi:hypothetical protein